MATTAVGRAAGAEREPWPGPPGANGGGAQGQGEPGDPDRGQGRGRGRGHVTCPLSSGWRCSAPAWSGAEGSGGSGSSGSPGARQPGSPGSSGAAGAGAGAAASSTGGGATPAPSRSSPAEPGTIQTQGGGGGSAFIGQRRGCRRRGCRRRRWSPASTSILHPRAAGGGAGAGAGGAGRRRRGRRSELTWIRGAAARSAPAPRGGPSPAAALPSERSLRADTAPRARSACTPTSAGSSLARAPSPAARPRALRALAPLDRWAGGGGRGRRARSARLAGVPPIAPGGSGAFAGGGRPSRTVRTARRARTAGPEAGIRAQRRAEAKAAALEPGTSRRRAGLGAPAGPRRAALPPPFLGSRAQGLEGCWPQPPTLGGTGRHRGRGHLPYASLIPRGPSARRPLPRAPAGHLRAFVQDVPAVAGSGPGSRRHRAELLFAPGHAASAAHAPERPGAKDGSFFPEPGRAPSTARAESGPQPAPRASRAVTARRRASSRSGDLSPATDRVPGTRGLLLVTPCTQQPL